MAESILGIDIRDNEIRLVRISSNVRRNEVTGFARMQAPPTTDGGLEDPVTLARMVRSLVDAQGLASDSIVLGLPAGTSFLRRISFPFTSSQKIEQVLPFELESDLPVDVNETTLSFVKTTKDKNGPQNVMAACLPHAAQTRWLEAFAEAGLEPDLITICPDGLFQAWRKGIEKAPDDCVLLDVGQDNTSIVFIAGGRLANVRSVPVGRYLLTGEQRPMPLVNEDKDIGAAGEAGEKCEPCEPCQPGMPEESGENGESGTSGNAGQGVPEAPDTQTAEHLEASAGDESVADNQPGFETFDTTLQSPQAQIDEPASPDNGSGAESEAEEAPAQAVAKMAPAPSGVEQSILGEGLLNGAAMNQLARELELTVMAAVPEDVIPETIFVSGEGVRIAGLADQLAATLEMDVKPLFDKSTPPVAWSEPSLAPHLACAWGLALRGQGGAEGFNFRVGQFAPRNSGLDLQRYAMVAAIILLVVGISWGISVGTDIYLKKERIALLDAKTEAVFKRALPELKNKRFKSSQLESIIKSRISGMQEQAAFGADDPTRNSIVELLGQISNALPSNVNITIKTMTVDRNVVQINAVADGFNTVENAKNMLVKLGTFNGVNIKGAKAASNGKGVDFRLEIIRSGGKENV